MENMRVKLTCLLVLCCLFVQERGAIAQETFDESTIYNRMYRLLQRGVEESGNSDLDDGSYGQDFVRVMFYLNEMPTDVAACCWGDEGILPLCKTTWDNTLPQSCYMFERMAFGIYTCNFYLENTANNLSQRRAEARFLRALCYYYLLDFFGNVPISTTTQSSFMSSSFKRYMGWNTEQEILPQSSRQDVYAFIESELLACADEMAAPGQNTYGRADKAAAWLLLARLYQNAEVYTGTAQWAKALEYANKIINSGVYSLCPSYEKLFMGDNNTNGAQNEMIFSLEENGENDNYGNTTFLIAASYDSQMPSNGLYQEWAGLITRRQLVEKFAATDARYMFYSNGHTLDIEELNSFNNGYAVTKWTNVHSDGTQASNPSFADTDFPLFRYAEALLIAAEADARLNGGSTTDTGTARINEVRSRANAETQTSYTLDDIIDEYAREFYFEGHRRTDLIRFGKFTGDNYLWQWKGGVQDGQAIPAHLSLFPLPASFMGLSEDYVQNTGYKDVNKYQIDETFTLNTPAFASQKVALRDYHIMEFTWQKPSVQVASSSDVEYYLQVSPSGKFFDYTDEGYDYRDAIKWGVDGNRTYINVASGKDIDSGTIETSYLDNFLLTQNNVKRWSDLPTGQEYDIYLRCVAMVGLKQSVSNIIKVTVVPYINNVNTIDYYFYGEAIADGNGTAPTVDGIGKSMVPMVIDPEQYGSGGYGVLGGALFSKTIYLEDSKNFSLAQFQSQVYTSDGTTDNATLSNSGDNSTDFTVPQSGWYQITLNPHGFYEEEGTTPEGWPNYVYKGILKLEGADVPSGNYHSVKLAGDVDITLQQSKSTNNRDWYGQFSVNTTASVHFLADGTALGGNGFAFGNAIAGGGNIILPAGNYIVTFDAASGYYDFFDVNLGIPSYPYQERILKENEPVADGILHAESVAPIDLTDVSEDTPIQVCNITELPEGVSITGLYLVIGDSSYPLNDDGSIDAGVLQKALTTAAAKNQVGIRRLPKRIQKYVTAYIYADYIENGLSTLKMSNSFTISVEMKEPVGYYYIGWLNNWDVTDKSYRFSTNDNDNYYLAIPGPTSSDGWFKIASGDNYDFGMNFWDDGLFIGCEYDGDDSTSGWIATGGSSVGAWCLPMLPEGYHFYNLTFCLSTGRYEFIPLVESGIVNVNASKNGERIAIYTLSGQYVGSNLQGLTSGIYIVNGKKVVIK